jgi:hypothetical protein
MGVGVYIFDLNGVYKMVCYYHGSSGIGVPVAVSPRHILTFSMLWYYTWYLRITV